MKLRASFKAPLVLTLVIAGGAIASAGCSAHDPLGYTSATNEAVGPRRPNQLMHWRDPNQAPPHNDGVMIGSAPAGAHLTYYGGRVISNVQVVQVLYGGSQSQYASYVWSTSSPSMATFYGGVGNSAYFDWLTEYNTTLSGGTNQTIGRGTFLNQKIITPSSANNGSTIDDSQIQSELTAQLNAGHLPAPTTDAAGNVNTIYMIQFPHGKTITMGGSSSCQAGGFCAYHGTLALNGQHLYYGVLPDMQSGSGCDTGCGSDPSPFNNQTSVASHELIEAVTDAEVGLATSNGPPLAWYDQTNGEIGDICNGQQGTIVGGDGVTYTVQQEFSNVANNCIVTRTVASNDFSISTSPTSLSVQQGTSGTDAIATAVVSGSAETISLSVSGLPSGTTGSFSPTSVSSGGSSTLTLNVGSATAAGTYALTVTGTASSGSHAASIALTVTSTAPPPPPPPGITNGGFETGDLTGWTASGASTSVVSSGAHSGTYAARLGSTSPTNGDSSIAQTFTVPSGTTALSFWYKMTCPDTLTYDWATATLKDDTAGTTSTVLPKTCTTNAWTEVSANVTAGHSYTLTLTSHDDNYSADPTYTLYDDVAFGSAPPPPPPPPPGGVTNGGFETGDLTGWTSSGPAESVVSSGAHSGTYAARLGSTSPTNGASTITQSFTAPSGTSQLTLWYKMTCPDTVTYDWATVTLKDTTTGTTTTVLPKTCTTNAWTELSAAVTAGHSYTLTLTSRDDNYSADPTYTLYDDVAVQ